MLSRESFVLVTDNTGGLEAKIIGILGSSRKSATIGDVVIVAIQKATPTGSLKVGEVCKALIVRTRKEVARPDGSYIRFGDNAVIILDIDAKGEMKPKGKRITGPIAKELRDIGFKNVTNLAQEVI